MKYRIKLEPSGKKWRWSIQAWLDDNDRDGADWIGFYGDTIVRGWYKVYNGYMHTHELTGIKKTAFKAEYEARKVIAYNLASYSESKRTQDHIEANTELIEY